MITDTRINRLEYLDLTRCIAVVLVMYAHFVSVGSYALSIPDVFYSEPTPILPANNFTKVDLWLSHVCGAPAGAIGVTLFFLVTGYLMPLMMERYARIGFLINRFFRIFWTYMACTLVCSACLLTLTKENFYFTDILKSIFFKKSIVGGVIWTLLIEIKFYLLIALLGRMNIIKLIVLQICAILSLLSIVHFTNQTYDFQSFFAFIRFIPVILIGSSIFLQERINTKFNIVRIGLVVWSVYCAYFGMYLSKCCIVDSLYSHFRVYASSVVLFFFCKLIFPYLRWMGGKILVAYCVSSLSTSCCCRSFSYDLCA